MPRLKLKLPVPKYESEKIMSLVKVMMGLMVLIIPMSGLVYASRDEGMNPADGFFLPDGDPKAGKQAFAQLKCTSCHWIANDLKLSEPVAEKPGPVLGFSQANYAPGWLANSIVSPSHTIALNSDGMAENSELSRMGDFTETMTVRQLIDVVAYLRSLGEEARVKNLNAQKR